MKIFWIFVLSFMYLLAEECKNVFSSAVDLKSRFFAAPDAKFGGELGVVWAA